MDEASPYQTPQSPSVPPLPTGEAESGATQAFGVIHMVFGGIGILFGIWSIVGVFFSSAMSGVGMPQGPQRDSMMEVQKEYMAEVGWVSVMTGVFMLVLAGLLLTSGPKLWKKKAAGLRWSNRYAWTSIGTKVASIVVGVVVVMPASRQMTEALVEDMPGSSDAMAGIMSFGVSLGALLGPIAGMVYPILALIMLNRPSVTRFLQD